MSLEAPRERSPSLAPVGKPLVHPRLPSAFGIKEPRLESEPARSSALQEDDYSQSGTHTRSDVVR